MEKKKKLDNAYKAVIWLVLIIIVGLIFFIYIYNARSKELLNGYWDAEDLRIHLNEPQLIFYEKYVEQLLEKNAQYNGINLYVYEEELYLTSNNDVFIDYYNSYEIYSQQFGDVSANIDVLSKAYLNAYKLDLEKVKDVNVCYPDNSDIYFIIYLKNSNDTYLKLEDLENGKVKFYDNVSCEAQE